MPELVLLNQARVSETKAEYKTQHTFAFKYRSSPFKGTQTRREWPNSIAGAPKLG